MGKELLLIKLKHYIFGYNSKFQIILRVFSRKYNKQAKKSILTNLKCF
jgi:hypothetical protein